MDLKFTIIDRPEESDYYLCCEDIGSISCHYVVDVNIAKALNIEFSQYKKILLRYNAHEVTGLFFKSKDDAERAIEELESHVIMSKLIGD